MAQHEEQSMYYVNGTYCNPSEAKISVLDRGFLFGDAIYEVVRVHRGRCFRLKDHYERMVGGLTGIKVPVPFSEAQYGTLCDELIRRNKLTGGYIYLQVSRGAGPTRRHAPAANMTPTVVGFTASAELPGWKKQHPEGVTGITVTDLRWSRCDLKTTMLLANTMAKSEAEAAGAYEAILVAEDGTVREGSASTVFAVLGGTLRTHPASSRILPSITRKVVLELARANGIALSERAVSLPELRKAGEVFIVSTTNDICPIVRLDGQPVGAGKIGPVSARLNTLLQELMDRG